MSSRVSSAERAVTAEVPCSVCMSRKMESRARTRSLEPCQLVSSRVKPGRSGFSAAFEAETREPAYLTHLRLYACAAWSLEVERSAWRWSGGHGFMITVLRAVKFVVRNETCGTSALVQRAWRRADLALGVGPAEDVRSSRADGRAKREGRR